MISLHAAKSLDEELLQANWPQIHANPPVCRQFLEFAVRAARVKAGGNKPLTPEALAVFVEDLLTRASRTTTYL